MSAIEVRGVHKTFRIPHEQRTTLTERVLGLFRPVSYERFDALCGVDMTIEHGSFVGILGHNGSGKSTLLKIVAGLLEPDAGVVKVDGTVSPLLELGLGFSPELTVRENVELYGTVLGYPRRELPRRVESAVAFAELERFRDAKLKNLSTGMQMRLAFATALQAESDILLLDEVLAVGDAAFQRKCLDVFVDLKRQRKTIVLVTHNFAYVHQLCTHAVLLEHGQVISDGAPEKVIGRYLELIGDALLPRISGDPVAQRPGDGAIRFTRGWIEDERKQPVVSVRSGDRVTVVLLAEVLAATAYPVFGILVKDADGADVYHVNNSHLGVAIESLSPGQTIEIRLPLTIALSNNNYGIHAIVANRSGNPLHDWANDIVRVVVWGSRCPGGVVDLQAEFNYRMLSSESATAARDQRAAS